MREKRDKEINEEEVRNTKGRDVFNGRRKENKLKKKKKFFLVAEIVVYFLSASGIEYR